MIAGVTDALILAAGSGSRLSSETASQVPKPLVKIAGRPLISYTIDALVRVGVRRLHVVVGANGDALTTAVRELVPAAVDFHPILNPEWQRQNGVSVLCAEHHVRAPFFLTMADHLFEFRILEQLLANGNPEQLNLAVDCKISTIFDLDDAMKVQTEGDRVLEIGKQLTDYNAVDTGVFLAPAALFARLRAAQRDGDCSLADGVAAMARTNAVRALDIGEAWWQDVDTAAMLTRAEEQVGRLTTSAPSSERGTNCEA